MKILAVDTALGACSVAVLDDERVLAHRWVAMERGHAEALAPMVKVAMEESAIAFADLERLAVTTGPGTFTGQRVGLAFARGLRIALNIPLTGVTTLEAMAAQATAETGRARAAIVHDAKREEVYCEIVPGGAPALLAFDEAVELLRKESTDDRLVIGGTAAPRIARMLGERIILSPVQQPDALWVARLALKRPPMQEAPQPLYLRAPDAKLPKDRRA